MLLFCSLAICSMLLPSRWRFWPFVGHEHLDEVPAPVEQAARAAAPVGHAALLRDRAFDRLGRHRLADFRVAEGAHALLIGQRHDLVPGRHAAEEALGVGDVLVLRHVEAALQVEDRAGDGRQARAVAARAALEPVLEPLQVLDPLVGIADRIRHQVVDRRPAGARRQFAGDRARLPWCRPARRRRPGRRRCRVRRARWRAPSARRHRQWPAGSPRSFGAVEKPSAPSYIASRISRCIAAISSAVALTRSVGGLAHHIAADAGMADQRADIDAALFAERIEIVADRLPGHIDPGLQAPAAGSARRRRRIRDTTRRRRAAPAR